VHTADLDELTYDLDEDGALVRRQLERVVLTRGAWSTVLFLYEELDRRTGAFRPPRAAVVRFQKVRGGYRKHSAFVVGSADEMGVLLSTLGRWAPRLSAIDDDAPRSED